MNSVTPALAPLVYILRVHLEGLTYLSSLELYGTKITDAGLVYLKGLTNLTFLTLSKEVTDAGVAELQKALPNCVISRYPPPSPTRRPSRSRGARPRPPAGASAARHRQLARWIARRF